MSSSFCTLIASALAQNTRLRRRPILLLLMFVVGLGPLVRTATAAETSVRFADVVTLEGGQLHTFDGLPLFRLAVLACGQAKCHPIPFQIDERDAGGHWVLDEGPQPNLDTPPGVFDPNDALLFMAADSGQRAARAALPKESPVEEVGVYDPLARTTRFAYVVAFRVIAPRARASYVHYDPVNDRVTGALVTLGFQHGVPSYLALNHGGAEIGEDVAAPVGTSGGNRALDLLDRFKVRASATFLWGLIHFGRNEDDLRTQFVAWHAGPIRVIRAQRQWVHIGWGIRSPTFGSYTYFYRDFAELPVGLHLNFPPTYFFGNIVIRAVLDFRNLRGWSLVVPGVPSPISIDGTMTPQKKRLNELPGSWFALRGPNVTLVQSLKVSPSLATVRCRLFYEEGATPDPPERFPGEEPGIGYRLDRWEHVRAGQHWLQSTSYALPPSVDVRAFMHARHVPLRISVRVVR